MILRYIYKSINVIDTWKKKYNPFLMFWADYWFILEQYQIFNFTIFNDANTS
jgi:hypothetical protein